MSQTKPIPCGQCQQMKTNLHQMGFQVGDCAPYPSKDGYCTVGYTNADDLIAELAPFSYTAAIAPQPVAMGATQKRAALAIVNLFETSSVLGNYAQVTLLAGDNGHLTFGRSQTTLGSGNLAILIGHYCEIPGASMGERLAKYLPRLRNRDLSLDQDGVFKNILRASADDHLMRDAQDIFFDTHYWMPALERAAEIGIKTPLGIAVVYDSTVQGSWPRIRDATNEKIGTLDQVGEKAWIKGYVQSRLDWMVGHSNTLIGKTRYRMDSFQALIDQDRWGLDLPMVVRGQEISLTTLSGMPDGCYDGPPAGSRALAVQSPLPRGADVRQVQLALSDFGMLLTADGVFGPVTAQTVKEYQVKKALPPTGVADIGLIAALLKI